jgi:large conductance mechanosensitive channel
MKGKNMLQEFKKFALRGNVMDMAVGIIIGGAFGKIITSLVGDILMPPIGKLLGGVDFTNLFIVLGKGTYPSLEAAKAAGVATINYGVFINTVINFIIVAFSIFMLIKAMNVAKKKEAEAPAAPAAPPREEILLTEIRDLLAKK